MIPPPKLSIIRTCPEHRVRIFEREQLLERAEKTKEFRKSQKVTKMVTPRLDHKGNLRTHNVETYLLDDRYPAKHERHIVLRTHHFECADGSIGGSGKLDPKEITVGDSQYRQLECENPRCELCEGGDMIPREQRFMTSTYKP